MIQSLLTNGNYKFRGTLEELKHCVSSFKVTKVIRMGEACGCKFCDVEGKFRYHGVTYKVFISKLWNEDILIIENRGERHD